MESKLIDVQWPAAGINRRYGFQKQPPYSTPDALNVQVDATPGFRERGGSRHGLAPYTREVLGSGNPIRLLSEIDVVDYSGRQFWADDFESQALGTVWTQGSWLAASPSLGDSFAQTDNGDGEVGLVRDAFSPTIEGSNRYEISLLIVPHEGSHHGTYKIFARMSGTDPTANGVIATLTLGASGAFSGSIKTYVASSLVNTYNFTAGDDSFAAARWFTLKVNGDTVTAYWGVNTLVSQNISADSVPSGHRLGFGMEATASGGKCKVDTFRVEYDRTGENQRARRRLLVASSNGTLYVENFQGNMESVSSSLSLASDRTLQSQQRLQKLYIADWSEPKVRGTDGARGTGNDKLDAASVADWTTLGISTNDDVLVISNATGDISDGTYYISSVSSSEITLSSNIATSASGTCTFRIERGPKVYDPKTGALSLWTPTTGSIPVGCPIIALYRDRLLLAGDPDNPHQLYASRQGNPLDFNYLAEGDPGSAFSLSATEAGLLGEPITALIPHQDQCMIIGCNTSLWLLRGDPQMAGRIDQLSRRIGVVSQRAWCATPDFRIVFLSHDGLYMVPEGCGSGPVTSISREKIPDDLLHLDPDLAEVSLSYDVQNRCIHIYVTRIDESDTFHWIFDWETQSFWKWSLQTAHEPLVAREFTPWHIERERVVMGCRDGYLRFYSPHNHQDDGGNVITSYVYVGPFNLGGGNYYEGAIDEITGVPSSDSGDIDYEIYIGKSHEQAYRSATAAYSGSWNSTGLNAHDQPRAGGAVAFLKLKNGENRLWSLEELTMRVTNLGRRLY